MEKRKPEFPNRWILDNEDNPIQVNIWQSSQYRHGSDWDYTNYIEDLNGKRLFSEREKWKKFPGFETKEQAENFRLSIKDPVTAWVNRYSK